jgi:hypothetical protein
MAIFRRLKADQDVRRVAANDRDVATVADLSYENDALAQLIVDAWVDQQLKESLLRDRDVVKSELAKRGIHLRYPVIIDEDKYWSDSYIKENDNEVVFVLPDHDRVASTAPQHGLLETAKFLMACVPNGI